MDTKIWTYKRMSDGAEFTLTTEEVERAVYMAMRGADPFEQASHPEQGIEPQSGSHAEFPLAA